MLNDLEIGEFIFRPSSRGPDNITLSWKFYDNNIVHIDIVEHDKAPGATIGAKLQISREEHFENLQEIVDRYIVPCNKFVADLLNHTKFKHCDTLAEFENALREEKKEDENRIPYKLTILPEYPQHIVIGYIPKINLTKEFIKVS